MREDVGIHRRHFVTSITKVPMRIMNDVSLVYFLYMLRIYIGKMKHTCEILWTEK